MDLSTDAIDEAVASLDPAPRGRVPVPWIGWGGWALDDRNLTAPETVRLRTQEAALLHMLMSAEGRTIPTEALIVGLDTTRDALRCAIKTLRRAIGASAVVTVRHDGYRLATADVAASDPVDELIRGLELALGAAKRLRATRRAGL